MRCNAPITRILLCSSLFVTSLPSLASEMTKKAPKETNESTNRSTNYSAAAPLGATLPEGVGRVRLVHRSYDVNAGFNGGGEYINNGFQFRTAATALVADVAINDKLTFSIMVPYIYVNSGRVDQPAFRDTSIYQEKYTGYLHTVAEKLQGGGACHTAEQCREFIEKGEALSHPAHIVLPTTGEEFTVPAHKPLKAAIEERILAGATPAQQGSRGLGDILAGVRYNAYRSEKVSFSTGFGLNFPTGTYNVPKMALPNSTGSGLLDAGVQVILDYRLVPGLWLSFQEQVEHAVTKAKWQRPSDINSKKFNLANPSEGGDGEPNKRTFEKRGFSYDTQVKANYGLGVLTPVLNPLALNAGYQYKVERKSYLDKKALDPSSELHAVSAGMLLTGLPYKVPVELELNYAVPVAGRHKPFAPKVTETQLKVYARF